MCERFSFSLPKEKIVRRFAVKVDGTVISQYNISPGQSIAVITDHQPKQLSQAVWGLPHPKTTGALSQLFIKSTTEKPMARSAQLLAHRCLILADGFYLWKKASRKSRVPYRVTLKWNIPFAFAGIWQPSAPEAKAICCAIVTTDSNDLVAPLSARMPLILPLEQEREWLQPTTDWSELTRLVRPYPASQMRLFPVSAQVNQSDINIPDLMLPSQPTDQFGNYILFE